MNIRLISCLFLASLLFCTSSSFAQDNKGRLPDGRAFRTDSAGNQLVDYIAELELMNDALRRQVSGLETEVEQKQGLIDKIGSTGRDAPVVERDLISTKPQVAAECKQIPCDCSSKIQEKVRETELRAKQNESEFLRRINSIQAGKSEDLALAQQTIERLKSESAQKDALLRSYEQGVQTASNEKNRLQAVLQSKNGELASLRSESSKLEEELSTLSSRVSSLQSERESLSSQEAALLKVISEKKRAIAETQKASDEIEEAPKEVCVQQVSVSPKVIEAAPIEPESTQIFAPQVPSVRASYSMARETAFDSLRGRLTTNLNQIQGLISSRDRMYNEYMRGSQVVAFKPAQARSSRGLTIPQIRNSINEAQTARELSLLTREINEIRSKIEFDIGMMERVKRLR